VELSLPTKFSADQITDPAFGRRARRGRQFRNAGWMGISLGVAVPLVRFLFFGEAVGTSAATLVGGVSLACAPLINWTRIWVQESRDPFRYSYSVAEFEPGPEVVRNSLASGPIQWLSRDLTEKLADRIGRLSLLDDADVPAEDTGEEIVSHVHISGWYGLRRSEDEEWCVEVVPRVRVGGKGAPAELSNAVHFKLDEPEGPAARRSTLPPALDEPQYQLLLERVYWAVASRIYAQIRESVEQKAMLLPPGRLRATAYLNEAHDYARSNTLDAFDAARDLYRKAQESYDRTAHRTPATWWRKCIRRFWEGWDGGWSAARQGLSRVVGRCGHRELLAAEADLGYARMLIAQWNLRVLCGVAPKELYEAPPYISGAIKRLEALPDDIPRRCDVLFQAYVARALARSDLRNPTGAKEALEDAAKLLPADAAETPEFLIAEAAIAGDPIRSLRLLTRAVERDPKHERAHFMKAQQLERLWRQRDCFEPLLADALDGEYAEVIAIDPGNISAWANRGYVGWLLSAPDPKEEKPAPRRDGAAGRRLTWRQRSLAYLDAGRRYKDVRRDAMVGELNWNLVRFQAEAGAFGEAYENYVAAVSAMLGEPRMGFVDDFYSDATQALRHRYERYEKRVRDQAKLATRGKDKRLVASVLAFVLNDCGGAHYSYYRRSGNRGALYRAVALFKEAIEVKPSFVLAKFNLAQVEGRRAEDGTMSTRLRRRCLKTALRNLAEVVQVEKFWTFPLLQMARLEALRQSLGVDFRTELAEARKSADPHTWLQSLLPQPYLRGDGRPGGKIDDKGDHVNRLLKDRQIRWDTDFNEVQVTVLISWAELLTGSAPDRALDLCKKLQEVFYEADPLLLKSRIRAARQRLAEQPIDPAKAKALAEEIEICERQQAAVCFADLRADPAFYERLNSSFERLESEERLEILSRAPIAKPSPQVETLLARLADSAQG
jgi:hypothetical protein